MGILLSLTLLVIWFLFGAVVSLVKAIKHPFSGGARKPSLFERIVTFPFDLAISGIKRIQ